MTLAILIGVASIYFHFEGQEIIVREGVKKNYSF